MPGRLEYERAIRRSNLPWQSRHLALTIATWADLETGRYHLAVPGGRGEAGS